GFEIPLDRFDLPQQASLTLIYETPAVAHRLEPIHIRANHAQLIAAPDEIACDCCAGVNLTIVGKKEGLALRRCQNCGLVFTSPRPDFSRIRQRYSEDYFEREYLPGIHAHFEGLKQHWNNILDHVEPFKSVSPYLFEVGTGGGYLLQEARQRGWLASGIDLNPTAVNYARQHLGLEVVEAEIHQIDLPANKFGAIISESTLEHFLSPRQVIAKCAHALHPGGALFIWTLGDEGDLMMTQGMDFIYVGPSEHLYHFPTSALSRLCELAGLRVEHFWRDSTKDSVALVASKRLDRWD
ncbi:MAG: class I SAM-dependent methyltransferase, partial [Chloroflexi bacterium]|nr:class I SAM-dependent methyltransferase [Chloroflexota bacterium]